MSHVHEPASGCQDRGPHHRGFLALKYGAALVKSQDEESCSAPRSNYGIHMSAFTKRSTCDLFLYSSQMTHKTVLCEGRDPELTSTLRTLSVQDEIFIGGTRVEGL